MSETKMWTIELEASLRPMELYRMLEKLHDEGKIGFFYIRDFDVTWRAEQE